MHELDLDLDDEYGHHELRPSDLLFRLDHVNLTTIGVDVGSTTMHLMFAQVHLHRETKRLSSRFVVVDREVLWRSDICLTPFRGRDIDADKVLGFVAAGYDAAGITPADIDSGAVILTGEAIRQRNARALGDAIASDAGKFVCVSAGHHLEALLAAYGSGAIDQSRASGARLLHIDIGGGTTKVSLIEAGRVRATAAFAVGGRQVAWDAARSVQSTTAGARAIGHACGFDPQIGAVVTQTDEIALATVQAAVVLAAANGKTHPLERRLRLTSKLPSLFRPDAVTFSGGISEYVYGRQVAGFGDLGLALGRELRSAIDAGRLPVPVVDPGQGTRATVIGASQASMQVSGNTVTITHPTALPICNVPVLHPELPRAAGTSILRPEDVAGAIRKCAARYGTPVEAPLALAFTWAGDPFYERLEVFAHGIADAFTGQSTSPVILLTDADLAATVGQLLVEKFHLGRPLICLDGLDLAPFDYVDAGRVLGGSGAVPLVIKSLLFDNDTLNAR